MVKTNAQLSLLDEIIVDNFAGGGGASTGIELATGLEVTIAINHDPDAIAMHRANHPYTQHYQASVWDINPLEVCAGRLVGLAWFSPDCKHFSKAKGGKPVDKNIRGLAWITLRWAGTVRPRVIILENVEEFQTWGPVRRGKPVKSKSGETFRKFVGQLQGLGYQVEWRELVAADYGAPTTRKRFFLLARCDGQPFMWPEPAYAPAGSPEVKAGLKKPWRSAAEIIDWTLPCPSIFDTREQILNKYGLQAQRPLRPNTIRRVARGVDKFVIRSANPFLVSVDDSGKNSAVVPAIPWTVTNTTNSTGHPVTDPVDTARTGGGGGQMFLSTNLIQYHTEQTERVRGQALTDPIMTIDAANRYGLAAVSLIKYYGSDQHGQDVQEPLHTITAKDREAVAMASLVKLKGTNLGGPVTEPVQTITAGGGHHGVLIARVTRAVPGADLKNWPKIRKALNEYCDYRLDENEIILFHIHGAWYFIADIGLRMLTPGELYAANGFPPDYIINRDSDGKAYGKSKQVAWCGNAVPPPFASALVRVNLPEWCPAKPIETMRGLVEVMAG